MSKYGLIVNVDKCIGCQACFVACKEENRVAPGIQWNQIHRDENLQEQIINYYRMSCQHCDNPACLPACPVHAIYKGDNGEVLVGDNCIGCQTCYQVCPYGAPKFNTTGVTGYWDKPALFEPDWQPWQKIPQGRAQRCTLCVHRTSQGQQPKCVEVCPTKALVFVDYDNLTDEQKPLVDKSVALNAKAGTNPKVRYVASHADMAALTTKMN